jgi:predicted HTH transcriptional regulator
MNAKRIKELIAKGENLTTEFKQRFSSHKKIAKEIIAFANTKGGIILFGVNDNGKIYGVESEKETHELIKETIADYCEPTVSYKIDFTEYQGRELVVLSIYESENKPHRIQDYKEKLDLNTSEVFIRVNDKSLPASKELIKILQAEYSGKKLKKYSVGNIEKTVFEYLAENDHITVNKLKELANISNRRASRTLIKMVRANLLYLNTEENGRTLFTSS